MYSKVSFKIHSMPDIKKEVQSNKRLKHYQTLPKFACSSLFVYYYLENMQHLNYIPMQSERFDKIVSW